MQCVYCDSMGSASLETAVGALCMVKTYLLCDCLNKGWLAKNQRKMYEQQYSKTVPLRETRH